MSEKKRWICLYVENEIGVLARISGLFSGKSYTEQSDCRRNRGYDGIQNDDQFYQCMIVLLNR